jgi:DNA modification methylase
MTLARQARLTFDDLDELAARAHPENPKRHDLAALDASVERFGYVTPVVINDSDGRILEGHGRVELLLALRARGAEPPAGVQLGREGEWRVPAVHGVDLSPDDARAFLIAANRIGELGGWDEARLAQLLSNLRRSGQGLDAIGFSEADLAALLTSLGESASRGEADPDAVPEAPAEDDVYVRPGQLWRLGVHRVLCGNAADGKDAGRLLGGRSAEMTITDPPYNVRYGHHGGACGSRVRPLTNDSLPPAAWEEFVRAWARQLLDHVDGAIYVFMSTKEWPTVSRLLAEAGGHWSDSVIWAKDRFTLRRADYQHQFEPIWYGWREGNGHYWCGDRDQGDVRLIPRPSSSDLHPTMKPVALIERAIANSSPRGGRVLDLFLGSGTTIIASERLGRQCLGMEIEPRYIQVSIERWQHYTGRKA